MPALYMKKGAAICRAFFKEMLMNSVLRANRCVAVVLKPLRTTKYARALCSSRLALHSAKPNFSAFPELISVFAQAFSAASACFTAGL
jgi:hypothetical protein